MGRGARAVQEARVDDIQGRQGTVQVVSGEGREVGDSQTVKNVDEIRVEGKNGCGPGVEGHGGQRQGPEAAHVCQDAKGHAGRLLEKTGWRADAGGQIRVRVRGGRLYVGGALAV